MTLANVRALRLSIAVTSAIAVSYGIAWPLSFMAPLFVAMFLSMPIPWMGWKAARSIIRRLCAALLVGLLISEFFLRLPLVCFPLYALLFFGIFYNDAKAPPLATILMTMGITMIPIISLQATIASHIVASYLLLNMLSGFVFTWLFHLLIPDRLAAPPVKTSANAANAAPPRRPTPPPIPARMERARLAIISTIVATSAVMIFFSLNLAQYALAMLYICMMAGAPNTNASVKVMKANSTACLIGGIAIIIAYNILVAAPSFLILITISLSFSLFFSQKITSGGPHAAAWASGFTTFLVLLGSSTSGDTAASTNFYLRIAQVLFAGIFCIVAIITIEHVIQKKNKKRLRKLAAQ